MKSNDSLSMFYGRFIFDTILAIILTNIMFTIIAGIIIDEFRSLKEALNIKLEDTLNVCFICGIDREIFDRNNINFEEHLKIDHYKWNYVFFIAYLKKKNITDLTGTESYVFDLYSQKSLEWLPVKK